MSDTTLLLLGQPPPPVPGPVELTSLRRAALVARSGLERGVKDGSLNACRPPARIGGPAVSPDLCTRRVETHRCRSCLPRRPDLQCWFRSVLNSRAAALCHCLNHPRTSPVCLRGPYRTGAAPFRQTSTSSSLGDGRAGPPPHPRYTILVRSSRTTDTHTHTETGAKCSLSWSFGVHGCKGFGDARGPTEGA